MKRFMFVLTAVASLVMLPATADPALAQSTVGLRLFETKCASCHQSAQDQKAPDASVLRKMTPEVGVRGVFQGRLTRRSKGCRRTIRRWWRHIWAGGSSV